MKIAGQFVISTAEHLSFFLVKPYYSAYLRYKWKNKEAGYGISLDLIRAAHMSNKKIIVIYGDYRYEISPVTVNNFYKESMIKPSYDSRGGKLIVVPVSKFTRLEQKWDQEVYDKDQAQMKQIDRLF